MSANARKRAPKQAGANHLTTAVKINQNRFVTSRILIDQQIRKLLCDFGQLMNRYMRDKCVIVIIMKIRIFFLKEPYLPIASSNLSMSKIIGYS